VKTSTKKVYFSMTSPYISQHNVHT